MNATQNYHIILNVLAATLQQYGEQLGLMVPGNPVQLAVPNGIKVINNVVVYIFGVRKSSSFNYASPRQFGNALQAALDQFCYGNCLGRILLINVKIYQNGRIALVLCV